MAGAFLMRNRRRKARVFRERVNPMREYDDLEFRQRFRLSKNLVQELYDQIGPDLEPLTHRNHAIPAMNQICTLRYYATGSFQRAVGDTCGISRPSASQYIKRVTDAICGLKQRYITFPRTVAEQQGTKEAFYEIAGMPNVIGAVDGTLINIIAPNENEHVYVSRKGSHSLNILAVCDPKMKYVYMQLPVTPAPPMTHSFGITVT